LIVTDTASQSRRHVEWGLEGPLTYNNATSLLIDSDNLVTTGFAGVQFAGSAYDPNASGNNAIQVTLISGGAVAACGTGNQSHIGSFRVKARVSTANIDNLIRFSYRAGDGPWSSNEWAPLIQANNWIEVDFGTITIPTTLSGTQRWTGQVEMIGAASSPGVMYVDYLLLVPVSDGYGKARASYSPTPGVIAGYDQFTSTTAGSALNARVAPGGGTWATSGDATDFAFVDGTLTTTGELISRSVTSAAGRFALLGTATPSDVAAEVKVLNDVWASNGTNSYDDFAVSTPAAEPIAVYSGRNMQIRYDDVSGRTRPARTRAARSPTAAHGSSSRSARPRAREGPPERHRGGDRRPGDRRDTDPGRLDTRAASRSPARCPANGSPRPLRGGHDR
jgi:hypothetical protein